MDIEKEHYLEIDYGKSYTCIKLNNDQPGFLVARQKVN